MSRTPVWSGAVLLAAAAASLGGRSAAAPPTAPPDVVPGRVLVAFRPDVPAARIDALIAGAGARTQSVIPQIGVRILQLPGQREEKVTATALSRLAEVRFAEPDRVVEPQTTPNDPWYANWEANLRKISCPTAWDATTGSPNVVIAILDTGVDSNHPDLAGKMVPGWNFYSGNSDTSDVYGHGTLVAGVAAASSNNGVGVASVAWGCKIMPLRVSDATGYATWSTIANALTWAADHGARVANISYDASDSSSISTAAKYFREKGGVVAVSAGNSGATTTSADNPYVLTVSATDSTDALYSWSNRGSNVDLAAPGWSYTTARGGSYSSAAGTSIAAPEVAGAAALVLSVNPQLTAAQVEDVLKRGADDLGASGWDASYGWGRLNVAGAVALAGGSVTPPLSATFAAPSNSSTVAGTTTVQVNTSVAVSRVDVYVDGALLGTATVAPYCVTWNTTLSSNNSHQVTGVATDSTGTTASCQEAVTVNNVSDTLPPSIAITSPTSGASVTGNVSVQVSASDNTAVAKVELYVDGVLKSASTSAPFTNVWNARKAASGAHTLLCRAYDPSGNVGNSASVTVYR